MLADPAWAKRLADHDRRALSPLFWTHVNPYGTFDLDMNTWDYLIAIDLRAGGDAGIVVDGAACAGLLGDFRLLGMRPSVVVANDERSVVLAERRT